MSSRDRTLSGDSSASNWGSLPRVASVASVLKRLFSREDRPEGGDGKTQGKIPTSSSAISLQTRPTGMSLIIRYNHLAQRADART